MDLARIGNVAASELLFLVGKRFLDQVAEDSGRTDPTASSKALRSLTSSLSKPGRGRERIIIHKQSYENMGHNSPISENEVFRNQAVQRCVVHKKPTGLRRVSG